MFRAAIAWVCTAALLTYLGFTTDFDKVRQAIALADVGMVAMTAVFFMLLAFVLDSAIARLLLRRTGFEVGFGEFARIKGASYLLNILNYNLALVLMAAAVKRRSGRGWRASGSPFLLLNFIDLGAHGLIAAFGVAVAGSPFGPDAPPEATPALILLAVACLAGAPVVWGVARLHHAPGFLGRLLGDDILSAFRALPAGHLAGFVVLRALFISQYIVMGWMFLRAFRFDVPFADMFVFQPVLGLIGIIPISVSGLGTTQVVMRSFFARFAPMGLGAAAVDAFSTASILAQLVVRIAIGLVCLPSVSRELREPAAGPAASEGQ